MKAVLKSQVFCIQEDPCNTILVEYGDTRNVYGFDYENRPTGFLQACRIPATLRNPKFEEKKSVYRKNDGTFVITGAIQDKVRILNTEWMNDEFHSALAVARLHKTFKLDGVQYSGHGDYNLDNNDFDNLQQAQVEVYEQGYNQTNISC